jgi:hypothetical protein
MGEKLNSIVSCNVTVLETNSIIAENFSDSGEIYRMFQEGFKGHADITIGVKWRIFLERIRFPKKQRKRLNRLHRRQLKEANK